MKLMTITALAGFTIGIALAHGVYSTPHGTRYCRTRIASPLAAMADAPPNSAVVQEPTGARAGNGSVPACPPPSWKLWHSQHGCPDDMLALFEEVGQPYSTDRIDMPALLAAIALPEASYRPKCSYKGHLGCCQVSLQHKAAFKKMGLDIYSERDRLTWACIVIRAKLDAGASLRSALQPWSTRTRVIQIYNRTEN